MSVYKVPQDVEADDKILGPFSFRQFIYLIIVAMAIAVAWGLSKLFVPLAIIPLPIILFFGAIALPLRKDQPMEIFMAAMVSFYLKPRQRKWDPDGIDSLIEITAPKTTEENRTKNISQTEAQERLSYLAQVVDSKGWAIRGVNGQNPDSPMNSEVYMDAKNTEDILDNDNHMAQLLNQKLDQSDANRRQEINNMMQEKIKTIGYFANSNVEEIQQKPLNIPQEKLVEYNKLLENGNINTTTNEIKPIEKSITPTSKPVINTSEKVPSAGIINLATNSEDLTIATIASQANRINNKLDDNKEVFISLR
jgi:hypothetical protein